MPRTEGKSVGQGDGNDDSCKMSSARSMQLSGHIADLIPGTVEFLDSHFYEYMSRAPEIMKNMRFSPMLEDRVRHWMKKLLAGNYPDYAGKRKRNMYLSNLLIQVKNGDLKEPFTQEPPDVLPSASRVFKLKAPQDNTRVALAKDITLNPKEYLHSATLGRTYMATKILDDNKGAVAYIGVSVGGDEPKWITPSGDEKWVPEREDLKVKEIITRGENAIFTEVNPGKSIHAIASERKPEAERANLVEFYKYVLLKIEEAKEDENFDYDGAKDELINQLIYQTKCEAERRGLPAGECNNYRNLLAILENRIRSMLAQAIRRNKEIQKISVQANVIDENPKLVDISSMRAFDPADDIWKTAVTAEPSEGAINMLRMHYPACVITALLMLLERQRQIIIDQEKKTHEQLVASMKAELLIEVKDGVIKYQEAQRKYNNMTKILKLLEQTIADQPFSVKDPMDGGPLQVPYGADSGNSHAKEVLVQKQLLDAQRRLELARQSALDIDDKMDEMSSKIADTQTRNEEANRMLKKDAIRWSQVICQMKSDLTAQQKQILSLQRFIETLSPQAEGCVY